MNPGPLVSVIIPAFNAEKHLAETLESLRAQTFSDFEAIIVDDGSTDRTAAVAQAYVEGDPRFRLFRQKNAGVAGARNAALAQAKGQWIAFLDADDVWMPEKLEVQSKIAREQPEVDFIFSNYFIWNGSKDIEQRYLSAKKLPTGDPLVRLISYNLFGISSVLVKRSLLDKVGVFDQSLAPAEDWDLWLRMAEKGFNPFGVFIPLLRYRVWSGNASGNSLRMAATNIRVLEKGLARNQNNTRVSSAYQKALRAAQSKFELAAVRPWLETEPERVPSAIQRAWRRSPSNLKWLLWYLGVRCPLWLGGTRWRSAVHKKIARKW